jgi:dihydroorotate dehydrogenase
MGGIESGAHAREFLAAGARAIAVGTASFRDPQAARRVRDELRGTDEELDLNLRSNRISQKTA